MSSQPGESEGDGAPTTPRVSVVGIGASAGGLAALEALTQRLAGDGVAFVVLQHLAPHHASSLPEILGRVAKLPVQAISDGVAPRPGTIYVNPPGSDLRLDAGVLRLLPAPAEFPHLPIDGLFRSLAHELGSGAIGVVLSGAGSDGTLGLRAIKDVGGITFAQAPATAAHSSMPQGAIDAGCADFVLAPAEIGDELMRLTAHPFVARRRTTPLFDDDVLRRVFERLRRAYGVDFGAYKSTTIERRLERRMALQKLDHVADYLRLLDASSGELGLLYSDLLIGVTSFFRDQAPFEYLKAVVFPRLLERRGDGRAIRFWIAGCATGEEAYSVAICLLEAAGERVLERDVQIFATDIDDHALTRARQGSYPASIEADVSAERLQRFFSRHERGYQVSRQVRDLVVFARHNLAKDPPFSRLDLVVCRNVLIYFQPALQRKVLRIFHYALDHAGHLLLGTSESIGDAAELFTPSEPGLKLYGRKNGSPRAVFDFASVAGTGPGAPAAPAEVRPAISVQQLADRKIIERYGPPGVLVDRDLSIIQFRGRTGPFLEPAPGAASLNLLKLARAELMPELRTVLAKAASEQVAVESPPIRLPEVGDVRIEALPLQDLAGQRSCLLVSFHRVAEAGAAAAAQPAPARDAHVLEIERQLLTTREYLESTVRELEISNEELQSSNEELQSSNEELQSSNEELETSKEELQSTNEELATVNDELQSRIAQLAIANDDLHNLMAVLGTPVLMVGMDLRMRRFSVAAERLLSLVSADVGRPVAYLGGALGGAPVDRLVSDCINTVSAQSVEVLAPDGLSYLLRATPYRTQDHAIRGAVLELARHAPATQAVGLSPQDLAGRVLSAAPGAMVLIDDSLALVWANKGFFETFQLGTEVLGRPLAEVWPAVQRDGAAWARLEAAVGGAEPLDQLAVPGPFAGRDSSGLRLTTRPLRGPSTRGGMTLLVLEGGPR